MDLPTTIAAPLLGLGIGLLIGLTGLGGGALMTPALILVLKMEPMAAIGTDLLYAAVTKLVGAYRHVRLGHVNWRLVQCLAMGSVPGALLGALAVAALERLPGAQTDLRLRHLLCALLIVVAAVTLWRTFAGRQQGDGQELNEFPLRRRWVVALGLVVGVLVTLTSVGSGTIVMAVLLLWFPLSTARLVGTDIAHAVILLAFAGASHLAQGHADAGLAGLLLLGSLPGVWIGAALVGRLPERVVKTALALLILGSGVGLV